ncbi:MAG: CopG family ribbon-helix-helix protein [Myxococcota bacterium]|nr:CopG family ribbon-helix-helix protein [Myxococcota bacterium]
MPRHDGPVVRFSVSLPAGLAADLEEMIAERRIPSRSHAVGEMIRSQLISHRSGPDDRIVAGTITLVYRDTGSDLRTRLTAIQRRFLKEVISSQHVFLEDDYSLEVCLVQGPGGVLRRLRDELGACRGVQQVQLAITAALLPPLHDAEPGAEGQIPRQRGGEA